MSVTALMDGFMRFFVLLGGLIVGLVGGFIGLGISYLSGYLAFFVGLLITLGGALIMDRLYRSFIEDDMKARLHRQVWDELYEEYKTEARQKFEKLKRSD